MKKEFQHPPARHKFAPVFQAFMGSLAMWALIALAVWYWWPK